MNNEDTDYFFFAILWFLASIVFFVFGIIAIVNKNDNVIAYFSMSLACQARCEIKILQKRLERK